MENLVFYFSGTGNCLTVAKTIAKELGNTEIVSMAKSEKYILKKQYDTVGFIYPTYFWGLPKKVIEFIEKADFINSKNAYYYSITTYGGNVGNAIYQIRELMLKKHSIRINYGQKLQMFSNYVVMYEMSEKVDEITKRSREKLVPVIDSIKKQQKNNVSKITKPFGIVNARFLKTVSLMDSNFMVDDNCTACGVCQEVCPVKNIEMQNGKPLYMHNCEQCLACIQFCPQKAINYKDATKKRRRYTHPDISYRELSDCNKM
jgi:ferredoxin/flavodoxin